ncbi:MAG: hypothetical protein K5865_09840 [Eubacterium sp.]|nr:hypothetical protein [Eubacterium sp.]
MRNCIKADLIRAQRKLSNIITSVIMLVLYLTLGIIAVSGLLKGDKSEIFGTFISTISSLTAFMVGIPVFNAVFSDDFKSHSMQTSIGFGVSRNKLVLSRVIEVLIMVVEVFLLYSAFIYIMGLCFGIDSTILMKTLVKLWKNVPLIISYIFAGMVFSYLVQGGTLGLVMYILLTADVFTALFVMLSLIPAFKNIPFENIFATVMYNDKVYNNDLSLSKRLMWLGIALVSYVVLPILLTMKIFKHKELEF